MRYLAIVLVLLVGLTACGPQCDVDGYKATIAPIQSRWEDAITLADSTPRSALSSQINELQAIKRDLDAVEADQCLNSAHDNLKLSYQYAIDGFLEFLAQADDMVVGAKFDASVRYFENYQDALAELEK